MLDLPDLIRAWRTYRVMATLDNLPQEHYQRLVNDFALVIRRRVNAMKWE